MPKQGESCCQLTATRCWDENSKLLQAGCFVSIPKDLKLHLEGGGEEVRLAQELMYMGRG